MTWKFKIKRIVAYTEQRSSVTWDTINTTRASHNKAAKICILRFNTSQEHVNEDLTLSLTWLHCLKPKWKQLRTTYAISWHPACGVVFSKDLSRSFCKFSWSWRRKYTYWNPIVSGWKWFSKAGSFFATSNLHEFPRKLVIFVISQKLA